MHLNDTFRPRLHKNPRRTDLIKDIKFAATCNPLFHYLSPIHVIKIDNPQRPEWLNYTDPSNTHIALLKSSNFTADEGIVDVYLVVDGQQRLTTLFMLFHTLKLTNLMINIDRNQIPKIILNPTDDHYAFCKLLGLLTPTPTISSMSQTRLNSVFTKSRTLSLTKAEIGVIQNGLKTLLIELDVHYGLRGFLTLNDRGKDLTYFEKLKSLIMEYDQPF